MGSDRLGWYGMTPDWMGWYRMGSDEIGLDGIRWDG